MWMIGKADGRAESLRAQFEHVAAMRRVTKQRMSKSFRQQRTRI